MVITYNRYRLIFSWPIEYKVTVKILKVAVNNSYLKVTVKHISTVQGSLARDEKGPVIQNHSCCMKESRLDQPCGDKS